MRFASDNTRLFVSIILAQYDFSCPPIVFSKDFSVELRFVSEGILKGLRDEDFAVLGQF